ncbi:hypothetical protein ACFQH6_17545 [Halobacteriaceae archaeon GCM10025711]
MTNTSWGDVTDLEEQGKYEEAAAISASLGMESIIEANFEVSPELFIGLGKLLRGMSCDARAANTHRVERLQGIVEYVASGAIEATSKDVERGSLHEWIGDSYLMAESAKALEHYSLAGDHYQDLDDKTQHTTGLSVEFDYTYNAYLTFVRSRGEEPEYNKAVVDFLGRIEEKQATARRLLSDDPAE